MGLLLPRGRKKPLFAWRPQAFEVGATMTLPAPFAGLNLRDDITSLKKNEARVLTNMVPTNGLLTVRDGTDTYASGMSLDGEVKTLVAFVGYTTSKMLAAANGKIYNVTNATETADSTGGSNDEFTKVLLQFDGTDTSTTLLDTNAGGSAHTWTAAGNAQIDTADSKFGGSSGLFDGTGDYWASPDDADFALGDDDFTIDFWFKLNGGDGVGIRPCGQSDSALLNATTSFFIQRNATHNFLLRVCSGSTQFNISTSTQFSTTLNTGWHHLALVRSGSDLKAFVDGVQEGSNVNISTNIINDVSDDIAVGRAGEVTTNTWNGWLDEFRISVGVARWGAAQTDVNGNDAFTHILLHFDGADTSTSMIDDNVGARPHTWTAVGNAQLDTAQSKFGGSSLLCDGTLDAISAPDSADYNFSTSDFTFDTWFQVNDAGGAVINLAGQTDAGLTAAASSFRIARNASNVMIAELSNGSAFTSLTGTTQFTNALNTGWHHLAFVRFGDNLYLFIDGALEDSDTFTGSVGGSTQVFAVGGRDNGGSAPWNGWVDEFRFSLGIARWTDNFTPPTTAYGGQSFEPPSNPYAPPVLATGFANDLWQTALYSDRLFFVNGTDTPQVYDGSTVTSIAWSGSGLTNTNLVNIALVRNRLWFCENNSADVWYGNVGQITAASALTKFQLSQIAGGGICTAIGSWSREDSGAGADDFTVFIMSTGEIIVYQGDPATTFSLIGKYMGAPPIGRQCTIKVGGELVVITRLGYLPVGAAVSVPPGKALDLSSIDPWGKIAPGVVEDAIDAGSISGWNGTVHLGTIYANVPLSNVITKQYVLNTRISAWTVFTEWNASCLCSFNNDLYFGCKTGGKVVKMTGDTDDGVAITCDISQAFVYPSKAQHKNRFSAARPHFESEGSLTGFIGINTDFIVRATVPSGDTFNFSSADVSSGALWDDGDWDVIEWGTEESAHDPRWYKITGSGKAIGVRLRLISTASIARWFSTDLIYKRGGIKG